MLLHGLRAVIYGYPPSFQVRKNDVVAWPSLPAGAKDSTLSKGHSSRQKKKKTLAGFAVVRGSIREAEIAGH